MKVDPNAESELPKKEHNETGTENASRDIELPKPMPKVEA